MEGWQDTLSLLRAGDRDAKDRVVRLVIGSLRTTGAYRLRDAWDDVVQDVLVALLEHGPDAPNDGAVVAYIRRSTLRRYVDLVRKEQGRRRAGDPVSAGWRCNVSLAEAESHLTAEPALPEIDLSRGFLRLEPALRDVLRCKYALRCTDSEGAAQLGHSLSTYKRLLSRALVELRRSLVEEETW